jgi:hypothetical protein
MSIVSGVMPSAAAASFSPSSFLRTVPKTSKPRFASSIAVALPILSMRR